MKTIHFIGGARPNFIKIAPLLKLFEKEKKIKSVFINTGQHYDKALSENINLEMPSPIQGVYQMSFLIGLMQIHQ